MKGVVKVRETSIWQKYAPPLLNELERLGEAFYALFPIVRFCPHLGSRAEFPQECTHEEHHNSIDSWKCRCCQSRRFRNIFGRYIYFLHPQLPTELTGMKIKNRAYGFRKWKDRLYFKVRRHPRANYEYYVETEQSWLFDLRSKDLTLLRERELGQYSALI